MQRFKTLAIAAILVGTIVPFLSMVDAADAATARVRCRVAGGRVRVQVDGQDLNPGRYSALLTNRTTGATATTNPSKTQTATVLNPDVDLDFDSTAQATDKDSFISPAFARAGNTVLANVLLLVSGRPPLSVASASTSCTQ